MTRDSVITAKEEALRFLFRVNRLLEIPETNSKYGSFDMCSDTAAVRRSSMDLTKALAELRKSQ